MAVDTGLHAMPGWGERSRPRVLLISYVFPPTGGAGVQRVTKFVKYLPAAGWDVSVLAPANASVPTLDRTLERDIPPSTVVRYAKTLEPSYGMKSSVSRPAGKDPLRSVPKSVLRWVAKGLLVPDPQVLWLPHALAQGNKLLASHPHDAVMASAPPFSVFLLAALLARRHNLPLLVDYRDEWGLSNRHWENKKLGPVSTSVQEAMQRWVLRRASGVTATTQASAGAIAQACGPARAAVKCLYNGFDSSDFVVVPEERERRLLRISYIGTLWNLTSIAPLAAAIELLAQTRPAVVAKLEVVLAGRCAAGQEMHVDRLRRLPVAVVDRAYLDHLSALSLMMSSDVLCALLSNLGGAERVMPGKVFEYLATGRPILAIAPRGELWDVLADYRRARCFLPTDVPGVAGFLERAVLSVEANRARSPLAPAEDSVKYSRAAQAVQLAEFLNQLRGIPSSALAEAV